MSIYLRGNIYWARWAAKGKRHRQSLNTEDLSEAQRRYRGLVGKPPPTIEPAPPERAPRVQTPAPPSGITMRQILTQWLAYQTPRCKPKSVHAIKTPRISEVRDFPEDEKFLLRSILLAVALSFIPSTAIGMSFSVPLPDLVGVFDSPEFGPGKEASFDVGQQFSAIQNVFIEVEAHVYAKEFDYCGTTFDPQPCVHRVQFLGFFANIDKEDSPNLGTIFSGGLSFSDDITALEGYGIDSDEFNNPLVGWDVLLDGEGSLTLFWNGFLGYPEDIVINMIEPSGEILNARLIIEGTPIPEPSTTMLRAAVLLVLAVAKKREPFHCPLWPRLPVTSLSEPKQQPGYGKEGEVMGRMGMRRFEF